MTLNRRHALRTAVAAASFLLPSSFAFAQPYPSRSVRFVVAAPPGGTADFLARLMGQWLSERLGQPFVIENRPGAGTNLATEAVFRAAPDGYTLLLVSPANAINASLYDKLNFNFMRDIASVSGVLRAPNVMVIHPSVPARTVPDFIAYAKKNPGKLSYASFGTGTSLHVTGEMFKMMAGLELVHVPYRGTTQALTGLIAGEVQLMFDNVASSLEHIRAGRLAALAVTTLTRSDRLPELPTMTEFLPGFESSAFFGIGVPAGTPRQIVDALNREINAGLADAKMKARLAELAGPVLPGSPDDFARLIAEETEKWAKVVKFAAMKPD
jgi:tripartite-type tricarboxylate transporter receptor subunit TctC